MTKKILLADDSVTIQKVVELTFSEGDFQVTSVSNGKLAIEQLMKDRPDIVIVDIIMPEMSGYDVAEYIKKNPEFSAIPVILLTGSFEPFDEERAIKTGAETYVTKPFDSKMLIEKVESLISQKVKVESTDKVAPATIFQSRQEYEIPGVVSEEYIEKLKNEQPQEFPTVEELKDNEPIPSSIAADFISSTEEIESPPTEENLAEETVISADNLPPSDFEGFESLSEPPLPNWDKPITEELVSPQEPPSEEEQVLSQEKVFEKEAPPSEIVESEIKEEEEQGDFGFKEKQVFPPPELGEEVVEISTPSPQETMEEEKVFDSNISKIVTEETETPSFPQENVIEVGEEVVAPSFFESNKTLETETPPETPEIVTDLSEQVIMVAEGQKIIAEEKPKEETLEESSSKIEEELSKEEAFIESPLTNIEESTEVGETEVLEKPTREEEAVVESPSQKIEEPSEVREAEFFEKPLIEEDKEKKQAVTEATPLNVDLSPEVVESVVKKVVEEIAPTIIKNIAWEVIPELANTIIKKRIEELEKETEK